METATALLKKKPNSAKSNKQRSKKLSPVKQDEKKMRLDAARVKFERLLPQLLKEHQGKYAVIIDDHVEIDEDEERLFKTAVEEYGYRTMYIGQIIREKKIVRMRSPRIKN